MRRKVAVIVDGPAAVPRALADEYDIRILPLHVIADGWDRPETEVDMDWLMERLRQRKDLPTTSTASIGETLACYEWAAQRASSAISIHVSSAFSKAYGAAVEARALADGSLPGLQIETVDSLTAEAGELAIAMEAARLAMQGADFSEVVRRTYEVRDALCTFYCFETLFYRDKGGRAFKAKPWAEAESHSGTGFRSLARVDYSTGGIVQPVYRAKTKKQLLKEMVRLASERVNGQRVSGAIVHVNADHDAECLEGMLRQEFNCDALYVAPAGAVTAIHSGEGFVTFAFYPVD